MKQLENVQILWHLGFWDGPLSGVLIFNNEMHYFDMIEEFEPVPIDPDDEDSDYDHGWYRKFGVYELSDDDKIRLITTHALWQGHMGLHTDYFPLNARTLRYSRIREKSKGSIPILHYGPTGKSDSSWQDFNKMKDRWESIHGKFEKGNREPIGFVYYNQLFGEDED